MKTQKTTIVLFALRLALGWTFFYAGLSKLLNPNWSAAGYLQQAHTFAPFYQWLTTPSVLPWVNALNEWSLLLLGISLLLGIGMALSTRLGALLMLLYYFPVLQFPHVGKTAYLIDEHIIYILVLLFLAYAESIDLWRLDPWVKQKFFKKQYEQTKPTSKR